MNLNDSISIFTGSADPIYRQIVDQVRRLLAGGQLRPGDKVPSVRELARSLTINPMTVSKAFSLLEAEGVLIRRRGLSMVVADRAVPGQSIPERASMLRPTLVNAAHQSAQLGLPALVVLRSFKGVLRYGFGLVGTRSAVAP